MTAPQPTPPEEESAGDVATVLALLIAGLLAAVAGLALVRILMRLAGMEIEALRYMVGQIGWMFQMPRDEPGAPWTGDWAEPQIAQYQQNVQRRASYLINASRRTSRAYASGGVEGLRRAMEAERRFAAQHIEAMDLRNVAARKVADAMRHYSTVRLGWYAEMDERTSAECRAANGRNFDPNRIPPIGLPGTVHPYCRCKPGAPFATRLRVEDIRPDRARGAA